MKDRFDDPLHHERTFLPRSYISLLGSVGNLLLDIDIVYELNGPVSLEIVQQRLRAVKDVLTLSAILRCRHSHIMGPSTSEWEKTTVGTTDIGFVHGDYSRTFADWRVLGEHSRREWVSWCGVDSHFVKTSPTLI